MLDLGGGHGRYAHELVQRGLRATLYDRPVCVDLARERYGDTLGYRVGDFLGDDLGGPYDAALLSNIVHGLGTEEVAGLFRSLHSSLASGGLLALKDMFLDDLGAWPAPAAFFGLSMQLYTREGRSWTVGEVREAAIPAGFREPEAVVDADLGHTLLLLRATDGS